MVIRDARESDADALVDIYNPYITEGVISFEYDPVDEAEMIRRIQRITERYPWIVYEFDGQIQGYAYASRWKERAAYHYCAETTVYLRKGQEGKGIGTMLYEELLCRLSSCDVKIAIGCIALPNAASVALHEKRF